MSTRSSGNGFDLRSTSHSNAGTRLGASAGAIPGSPAAATDPATTLGEE